MLSHEMHEGVDDSDDTPVVVIRPMTVRYTGKSTHVFCPGNRIFLYSGYQPLGNWDLNDPSSLDRLLRALTDFYAVALAA